MGRPGRSISHTGCATCRRRKVRCDERRRICGNCSRLGIACEWYPAGSIAHRSRVNKACERCRKYKIRCMPTSSATGPCAPCQAAMAECVNTGNPGQGIRANSARGRSIPAAPATLSPASDMACLPAPIAGLASPRPPMPETPHISGFLPDEAEQRRLVNAYFDGPHYFFFYTFIHPPTLMQMQDSGQVPDYLLLIILATALRYLEPQDRRADAWADECRRLVMLEIFSPPSTTTLQALLLLQRFEWHRAGHVAAWFVSGLAVRLAHGLQLNLEIAVDTNAHSGSSTRVHHSPDGIASPQVSIPATVRESRRRLVWSCFVMESLIESGRRPLGSLNADAMEVRLPCNEPAFQLGLETDMPTLGSQGSFAEERPPTTASAANATVESRLGISTFLVQLAAIRRAILDYTMPCHPRSKHQLAATMEAAPAPWEPGSSFFAHEEQLNRWNEQLPPEMKFTSEMLYRRRSSQLVSFVALHCLYHGCYCDLYRIGSYLSALHRSHPSSGSVASMPTDFLARCRRGRVQHAFAICRVIRGSMQHQSAGHDPVVGISASLATRVLVIERQRHEDASLGLTEPLLREHLDAAVACAKEISQRSIPIRDLFCSVCELAKKHGYNVDLSDITSEMPLSASQPRRPQASMDPERAASPSLRTYGTFGRIQDSLASREDLLAPAASTATDKESDLFHNYDPEETQQTGIPLATTEARGGHHTRTEAFGVSPTTQPLAGVGISTTTAAMPASPESWHLNGQAWTSTIPVHPQAQPPQQSSAYGYPAYETYSPNEMGVASAWGDATLNFSMMPTHFDWINQSLGLDFDLDSGQSYGSQDP